MYIGIALLAKHKKRRKPWSWIYWNVYKTGLSPAKFLALGTAALFALYPGPALVDIMIWLSHTKSIFMSHTDVIDPIMSTSAVWCLLIWCRKVLSHVADHTPRFRLWSTSHAGMSNFVRNVNTLILCLAALMWMTECCKVVMTYMYRSKINL